VTEPTESKLVYDCLVVGGGPAGLTAALQTARFNRRVMLFDSGMGRSTYNQINHNYLGFPGGVSARDLRELGRRQLAGYPVATIDEPVISTSKEGDLVCARTPESGSFWGRTIILATGVRDHFPKFPEWERFVGRSFFWCITCDGYSTRGKRIAVVGNDTDAGITALQFLQFTSKVVMLTNDAELAIDSRVCAELAKANIPLVVDTIRKVEGHDGIVGQIQLSSGESLHPDFLFNLQGSTPNSELAASLGVELSRHGYILADQDQRTNIPNVFAAGDVTRDLSHQVATAVHEGNTAAQAANYYLYQPEQRHETYK
jgi:thioredoxin reductase (NADPH)